MNHDPGASAGVRDGRLVRCLSGRHTAEGEYFIMFLILNKLSAVI